MRKIKFSFYLFLLFFFAAHISADPGDRSEQSQIVLEAIQDGLNLYEDEYVDNETETCILSRQKIILSALLILSGAAFFGDHETITLDYLIGPNYLLSTDPQTCAFYQEPSLYRKLIEHYGADVSVELPNSSSYIELSDDNLPELIELDYEDQ